MERTGIARLRLCTAALVTASLAGGFGLYAFGQQPLPPAPAPRIAPAQLAQVQIKLQPGFQGREQDDSSFLSATFNEPERLLVQRMQVARELIEQKRFAESARALGSILELPQDYFFQPERDEKEKFVSLKALAQRLIGEMPKEGREAYELQFGAQARAMLSEAIGKGSEEQLREVVRRFFHTQAGYQATHLLATSYLDQNRPLAGALLLARLRATDAAKTLEPMLSFKQAVCELRAGNLDEAQKTLVELKKNYPAARFTLAGKEVKLFDQPGEAIAWLKTSLGPQREVGDAEASQWLVHRGNPSRTANSAGDSPLLEENWAYWAVPVYENGPQQEVIRERRNTYLDQSFANIPSSTPLAVNGMVLMRTTEHLVAVDFPTGLRLWRFPSEFDDDARETNQPAMNPSVLRAAMDQRLWTDGAFGQLSSDGELVFSLHGNQQLSYETAVVRPRIIVLPNGQRTTSNEVKTYNWLVAHDIRTGKLRWEIGGPKEGELPNAPPLPESGKFFLGAPLPLGNQLFVLAEAEGNIHLLVLDSKTGRTEWTQQLAALEYTIQMDPRRRLAGVSPSFADGVLVCPTSSGAAVAIDLTTRSLLWGFRYPVGNTNNPNVNGVLAFNGRIVRPQSTQPVRDRWVDATVTLAEGAALLTPIESDDMHCLDLMTGEIRWQQNRDDGLYVAGVRNGKAFVVGHDQFRSVDLTTGKPGFDPIAFPNGFVPSGRGFQNDKFYFVPVANSTTGQIVKIDLDRGQIVGQSKFRDGAAAPDEDPLAGRSLGNLVCYKGAVLVQGVDLLARYDLLGQAERSVAAALKQNPNDPVALAQHGEILLHDGKARAAVDELRRSLEIKASDRTRELLLQAYLEGLRLDFPSFRGELAQIDPLIDTPEERLAYLRYAALGFQKDKDSLAAFQRFLQFGDPKLGDPELTRIDGVLSVRRDCWVRGRLAELERNATPEEQEQMHKLLADVIQGDDLASLRRQMQFFAGSIHGEALRTKLVDKLAGEESVLETELALGPMRRSTDPDQRAWAAATLGQRLRDAKRPDEAAPYYALLAGPLADAQALDGLTGREVVEKLPVDDPVRQAMTAAPEWPTAAPKVESRPNNTRPYRYFSLPLRNPGEFFANTSFEFDPQTQRVIAKDEFGRQKWTVSTNESATRTYGFNAILCHASAAGHVLVVSLGYQVIAIDTLAATSSGKAKVLWTQEVARPGTSNVRIRPQSFRMDWGGQQYLEFGTSARLLGDLGPCSETCVTYMLQNRLYALDPLTGDTLWARHNLTPGSDLFGDSEQIFVVSPGSTDALVLSALDGSELGTCKTPTEMERVATFGNRVLAWQKAVDGATLSLIELKPEGNREVWSRAVPAGAKASLLGRDRVGIVEPEGKFHLLAVADGKPHMENYELAEKETELMEIHLLEQPGGFTLITNRTFVNNPVVVRIQPIPGGYNSFSNPSLNGRLYGFDSGGKLLWEQAVEKQSILLSQPAALPIWSLASHVYERRPNGAQTNKVSLLAIDKRTGKKIIDDKMDGYSSIFEVSGEPDKRTIEITLQQKMYTLTYEKGEKGD